MYPALGISSEIATNLAPSDQLHISEKSGVAMITSAYAVLSGLTILVTSLIAVRLFLVRRQQKKAGGCMMNQICDNRFHGIGPGMLDVSNPYLSIVAMLVESYALDSAWSLITAVTVSLTNPSFLLFQAGDSVAKVRDLPFASTVPDSTHF